MNRVRVILPQTLVKLGIKKRYNAESVICHWREIVGDKIATHACPAAVHGTLLVISVTNSAWCHHLSMFKGQIISKINSFVGEKLITDIRFQAGYFKNYQNEDNTDNNEFVLQSAMDRVRLDDDDCSQIDAVVNQVADDQLRRRLRQFVQKQFKLKQVRLRQAWHQCAKCTAFCPADKVYCTSCEIKDRHERALQIHKLLLEAPWLNYNECSKYIECTHHEFLLARDDLREQLERRFYAGQDDRTFVLTLVMLITHLKPDKVTEMIIEATLEKIRRKKYGTTPRR
jgi:hypothetical protein